MEQVKPRLLLVVPMLHQGGFERVCVRTARILRNDFEVTIAMFSDKPGCSGTGREAEKNGQCRKKNGKASKAKEKAAS